MSLSVVGILLWLAIPARSQIYADDSSSSTKNCSDDGVACHGLPKNCWATDVRSCNLLATVVPNGDTVSVDIFAINQTFTNRWIGLGFSLTGAMPNTAVVHCIVPDNNTAFGKLTFNQPTGHFNAGWANVNQAPIVFQAATLENGQLYCGATLKKNFAIQNSTFDLSQPHKLLVATGPLVNVTGVKSNEE